MRGDFERSIKNLIAASGGRVWLVSGDRDNATQTRLWNEAVKKYGPVEARNWVAPPGKSNHERGIAADLGGDLALAARLAPQFGLYRPMAHEPWHFEPMGSRDDSSPDPYTNPPPGMEGQNMPEPISYGDILSSMIGGEDYAEMFSQNLDPSITNRTSMPIEGLPPQLSKATIYTTPASGGPEGIDAFMRALRSVESSGNYKAVGVPTKWGTAKGAYQFLDSTWAGYGGYARADEAPPEVQDRRARELMQEYYNKFGSWDSVAAAWYSGPGGNWKSKEVQTYVGKVKSRL